MRGPARAVMCETLDLDVMWPQWHTLLVEGQVAVDMRVVCPQDVKKMLLKQATTVHWKRMAAKHEGEELIEGLGADKIVRYWLVRRKEVPRLW